ncbi:hypothetical protein UlMin_036434 [Ulmus minor]
MENSAQAIVAAIASFFFITLIFGFIFVICKNRKEIDNRRTRNHAQTRSIAIPPLTSISVDESLYFDPSLQVSMNEILTATKNFSADLIVGDGSFGYVYKAQLSDGLTVAIKKLDPDAFQGFREFRAEMETLGKLRHRNLVKILGFCVSGADRILIYEFIEKGNLDFWLHDSSSSENGVLRLPLSWATRIKIVRGVANGLAYLHGLDKPIIHRDIKASNVLVDSEFEARIADFGLARMLDSSHSHVSTQVAGTMGYMPPEYKEGLTVATVKADVYSFGVLMLEIAMGRRPNLPMSFDRTDMGMVEWAKKMVAQNREMEMVDASVNKEGLVEGKVKEYFRIACLCAHESSRQRPAVRDVVEYLTQDLT